MHPFLIVIHVQTYAMLVLPIIIANFDTACRYGRFLATWLCTRAFIFMSFFLQVGKSHARKYLVVAPHNAMRKHLAVYVCTHSTAETGKLLLPYWGSARFRCV